ncbi:AAA family ATPase (plasmid) [Nostoc sp. UHCC 0926]|uniref:AAA family ATPase n=1 Tax=Nostoc sp. UHCC 0926 TaxID=3025190 RepID=UPI0023615376|nr:AAA family ATPase [Nostoc sp. UHCC 0926]WDD36659.1 AAA family ATPase [Nostoc sp. UHCC 0926]
MITLPGVAIQCKIYESSASLLYRGIRMQDGQAIVVKMLKQDYPSPQEIKRYRQEYAITCSLNIEGVIKAYSQEDYQRTLVILLEDFGAESLDYWIRQHPEIFCPMPVSTFLPLAVKLTQIIGEIHAANIIHKDINPGNIVLNPNTGLVKIIDFGIATQFNRTNPTFTSPHVLEGTLAYLSPEQTGRMNRLLDYRTDFYSLGVTFYQLLTGYLPFATTDILELVHCHIAKQPIPPCEIRGVGFCREHQPNGCGVWGVVDDSSPINSAIPKDVSDIVMKLMAKNVEDRYQSAWGIKADLELCAAQLTETWQIGNIQLGLQDVSDQFHIPQKLYGREAEIAALLAAFERVAGIGNEKNAQCNIEMMLVSGYAGIGKSALVQELYKPITAKRGYFTSGKFDQFGRNIPYSAIVDALGKLVQQLLGEPDEQVQQWRSRLLRALGSNGQLIIDVIPEVEWIIGKQPPVAEVGATEAQNRFNLVFQKFIRACCSPEHPLVIFLDDLQWVDSATLKLIELILSDSGIQALLLIGAYRDHEVTQAHSLITTLEKLKQETVTISQIMLAPLGLGAVAQLITETLHTHTESIAPLAELVWRKANGNPYFTNEFLKALYIEGLIVFDINQLRWQWDITHIKAKNITDNVVELIIGKLKQFPKQTQQVLSLAACVGAEFDLATLSVICERPAVEIFAEFTTVIQSELLLATSELDENLLIQNYKFSHDRVQQAAYDLIDESKKQIVHLQIGRNLLKEALAARLSDRLFEIVDHFNHGIELITNQAERDEIAKLNLIAGQKAKGSIAYGTAQNYLAMGRAWLADYSWQTNYDLALELYTETTKITYLCGEFENVEHWAEAVLQEAKTVLDSVKVYEVKIQTAIAQGQLLDAIHTALQVLQQLGIRFPETPNQSDITLELNAVTSRFNQKPIQDLFHLPEMVDPQKLAAMRIISRVTLVAYHLTSDLAPLLVLKQVNLSIQYGNTFVSPFAYANLGLIFCGMLGRIEAGYEFGQLALRLLFDLDICSLKARTLFIVTNFIIHWREHIRETSKPFLEAYQCGLETGDLEFAAYSAFTYCLQSFFVGKELLEVEHEMATYSEAIRQINQRTSLTWIQIFRQSVLNLMGRSINPLRLVGESYNEEKRLAYHETDGVILFLVHLNKLILCYLFSEYSQASENAIVAEHYLIRVAATPHVPLCYFYSALARLAVYSESDTQVQQEILKEVAVSQEKMRLWAHHAPMNYLHKYHLVQAETARVLGQLLEAEEFYEQAIQGAKENEYIQEEALAYELAAKFYLARGREKFAQIYMKEAHYCYQRWGATAKVNDLERGFAQFFPDSLGIANTPIRTNTGTTLNTSSIAFDLATVMKTSQAISSEIELDQLLHSLMQILIENAGAQTGCLLLENAGEWKIEAACELNEGEQVCTTRVMRSMPMADRLPKSIIQYVIRTHESVILNNATREGNFINEPYIQCHQTQSILCLPLLNQSKLVGVLYLENQLATGVFTPDRSQLLNLLSTQAAIAIQNAKLYSNLRKSESRMAQFLEAVPVAIAVLDARGHPYYANQRRIQLVGKGVDPAVTPDRYAEVYQFYRAGTNEKYPSDQLPIVRALRGERTTVDDMEIRRNNITIPIEAWGTPVFDEQGDVAYAIVAFQDITERRRSEKLLTEYNLTLELQVAERTAALQQSEAELRDREQELRLIADALPVLISYVDANWCYQFINRTYEVWFNRSRNEILGNPVRQLLGEAVFQRVEPYINQVFEGQTVPLEAEIPFPLGKRCISATLIPDFDDNAQVRGFYSLITDISDRKLAEAASILEERNRMAREIHDTLAQSFTGILLQVGAATQVLADDPEATQVHLEMIEELARAGLAGARRSVSALRPRLLEEGNLESALHRIVAQMRSTTDTALICETQGTVYSLPTEVENNLLRIGQEALTNAIKYASAGEIRVELVYNETQCILQIKDDGRGFGVGSIPSSGGFGLLGMSERAERISAQLRIQSEPGQGTEIIVTINRE